MKNTNVLPRKVEAPTIMLEVVRAKSVAPLEGVLVPIDDSYKQDMRDRQYKVGDFLSATLRKQRSARNNRIVHKFGALLAEHLDTFEGMAAHAVLKRLQWEANVGCDEMAVDVPTIGMMTVRYPKSLAFELMDEGEFMEIFLRFCQYVERRYWPGLNVYQIEEMESLMRKAA
jgi:hypothetical protein